MKSTYDTNADALYIIFKKGKTLHSIKLSDRMIVDIDNKGNILGIEVLDAKNQLSTTNLSQMSHIPFMKIAV